MAIMVDQKRIKYDDLICKHWPEFAQNEKDKLKIEDVMRHESGLHKLHKIIHPSQMFTRNIKLNQIGEIIETDTQVYAEGFKRCYHTHTRDLITNEIFRRVSENGRTMGEYIRVVLNPGFELNLVCGATEEELNTAKITDYKCQGNWRILKSLWKGPANAPVGLSFKNSYQFYKRLNAIKKEQQAKFPP